MRGKKSFFLWVLLFIFLTTYNFDFTANIENSIFSIREIELTGIKNSDENKIKKKLDEFKGKNIILISTKKLKETIKDFDFIREIKIKKIYPEKIKVEINELKPLAIFTNDNQRYLLLEAGKIIEYKEVSDSDSLTLVYGKGAEKNFYILHASLEELGFNKELIKKFDYFDINRWDIVLKDDKIIKLPVDGYEESLKRFLSIYKKENFSNFQVFDFRIKGQLILK
jgi:cell division protein FtsQ